tara:strand:- start:2127 stop:2402 length:276 start_codon:yes stop_codon:yes gene_type:complete
MSKVVAMKKKKLTFNQSCDKLWKEQNELFENTKIENHFGLAFNGISNFLLLISFSGACIHTMKEILNDSFERYIEHEEKILKEEKKQKAIK